MRRRGAFSLAAVFAALSGYTRGIHSLQYGKDGNSRSCCVDPTLLSKPIGNSRLFFGQCPIDKSPETLCAEASNAYGASHTSMYPVAVKSSYESHIQDSSTHYFSVKQDAAVALVGSGCCFNVFPHVMKDDKLLKICQNPIIGTDTLSILEFYSVYLAGDFFPQIPPAFVDGSTNKQETNLAAVIGGRYDSDRSVLETMINTLGVLGGNFPNNPLVIGGDVGLSGLDPPAPIFWFPVAQGVAAALGGEDFQERVMDPIVRIRDPDAVREQIDSQICALSKDLQAFPVNGNVDFARVAPDEINLTIACASGETCVVDIEFPPGAAQPDTVVGIGFSLAASVSSVIINVKGRMVVFRADFMSGSPDVPVVWNFYEAVDVDISCGLVWYGSFVVPRAGQVKLRLGTVEPMAAGIRGFDDTAGFAAVAGEMEAAGRRLEKTGPNPTIGPTDGPTKNPPGDGELVIVGSIVVGGVESHTSVFFKEILHSFPQSLPKPEPTVTMCECLCPDQDY